MAEIQSPSLQAVFLLLVTATLISAGISSVQAGTPQCPAGELAGNSISGSTQTCTKCDSSQAKCLGGGLVLPAPGWWQASPTSTTMNRCPNRIACLGFPEAACAAASHPQQALRQCHPSCNVSTPFCAAGSTCDSSCSTTTYQARQCAEGYSGVLCAVCAPGYGPTGLLLRCSKCISRTAAAALFTVALLVLLLGIRYWAFLAESENVELAAESCTMPTAAVQRPGPDCPQRLPQPTAAAAEPPPSPFTLQLAHVSVNVNGRQPRLGPVEQMPAVGSAGSSSCYSSCGSAAEGGPAPEPATAHKAGHHPPGLSAMRKLQLPRTAGAGARPARTAATAELAQSSLLPSTKGLSDNLGTAAAAAATAGVHSAGLSGSAGQHAVISCADSVADDGIGCSRSRPSDVLRCLLLFLQFWTILASMQLQWPPVIAQPLAALGAVLAAGHAPPLSVDCLITSVGLGLSGELIAVARVVLLFCMPFVLLLVLLLLELVCWWVMAWLHKQYSIPRKPVASHQHLVRCRMHLITLAAVFFFYPSLVRTCLQLFVCLPVNTGGSVGQVQRMWAGYANMQCGSGVHGLLRYTVGIVGVLCVCIGMPVGLAWLLLRSSQRRSSASLLRFGSLLRCYRGGVARAWESMIMVQTAVCVAITVFSHTLGEFYQACLMNVMLTIAVAMLLWLTPYRCQRLQRLMVGGAICLTVSSYVALILLTDRGRDSGVLPPALRGVAGALVLIGNMGCLFWGAYEMLLAMDWQRILTLINTIGRRMQATNAAVQRRMQLYGAALVRHAQ